MTRDSVLQHLREMGDQFLTAASKAGVEPNEVWGVYQDSLFRGADGARECISKIANRDDTPPESMPHVDTPLDPDAPRTTNVDYLRSALLQVGTCATLLMEMLPEPLEGTGEGFIIFDGMEVN